MRELRAGEVFGGYVVEGVLGRGGMGVVYRARETGGLLERVVALKLVRGGLADDPDALERFRREARLAATLEHPAVVPVYAADVTDGVPYVAMRLIGGVDLGTTVATEGPLDPPRALAFARQIAAALDAAHAVGLVHRDVKPANVLVDGERAYLTDFGLATAAGATRVTAAGDVVGTLAYLAPELIAGAPGSPASDRYALACTLVEALTGHPPFTGETVAAVAAAHVAADPPALSELRPGVPPTTDPVIRQALAKDPADRPASALALVDALEAALAGEPVEAVAGRGLRLPASPNRFVGRAADVERVTGLLDEPGARLVTLVGPGGVGKTRLALAVADAQPAGSAGWVALAPVEEPSRVLAAVAATLGVVEQASEPLLDTLARDLEGRPALLVLDNAEHLLDAAPDVAQLLARSPRLRLLVTSQAPLRIGPERTYPVRELDEATAAELFRERAEAAGADDPDAARVADICRTLDGLPLALELAAARLRMLEVDDLAHRLEGGLAALGTGARDLPERQRTMRGAIAWSYGLLDAQQRQLLDGLGVFAGGFTLAAVEDVLGQDVLDAFEALVEVSLVRDRPGDAPGRRFGLLATIREYALERLRESGDEGTARRAHALWVRRLADECDLRLLAGDPEPELVLLRDELANLRAALSWARASGEVELHAGIAAGLGRFFSFAGLAVEGLSELQAARAARAGSAADVAARVDGRAALLAFELLDLDLAEQLARDAIPALRALGEDQEALSVLNTLAGVHYYRGDLPAAEALLADEVIPMARALGDRRRVADSLVNLSELAFGRGEHTRAADLADEAVAVARAADDRWGLAAALSQSAAAALALDAAALARERAAEAAAVFDAIGERSGLLPALCRLGRAEAADDPEAGARTLERAVAIALETGRRSDLAEALLAAATVAARLGDDERAARLLGESAAAAEQSGMTVTRYPGDDELEARVAADARLTALRNAAAGR